MLQFNRRQHAGMILKPKRQDDLVTMQETRRRKWHIVNASILQRIPWTCVQTVIHDWQRRNRQQSKWRMCRERVGGEDIGMDRIAG